MIARGYPRDKGDEKEYNQNPFESQKTSLNMDLVSFCLQIKIVMNLKVVKINLSHSNTATYDY